MRLDLFRSNNFNLVRLFAALQVTVHHAFVHLNINTDSLTIIKYLDLFPGVPIFFFVSGFLITKSFERNPIISGYIRNRLLRIYPALIVCVFLSVGSVWVTKYFSNIDVGFSKLLVWILAQISFVQFYNPDFMRGYGTGVLNGSLWTVAVELQFYTLVPLYYWIFNLAKSKNKIILVIILFFMTLHIIYFLLIGKYGEYLLYKLWGVSFIPWLYMFFIGAFFQRNFNKMHLILSDKFLLIFPIYLLISYYSVYHLGWDSGNSLNPILYLILSITIFSFAYSHNTLGGSLLKSNDISYGIYIYHMPIVNFLLFYRHTSSIFNIFQAVVSTLVFAILSWFFIEKPAMKLKKDPLNPIVVRRRKST